MKTAIFVLGMHRSGTSALSGILHKLGLKLGTNLLPPSKANPKGYFESQKVFVFNDTKLLPKFSANWHSPLFLNKNDFKAERLTSLFNEAVDLIRDEYQDANLIAIKDPRICRLFPFWMQVVTSLEYQVKAIIIHRDPIEVANSLRTRDNFSIEKGLLLWANHILLSEYFTRSLPRYFTNFELVIQSPLKVAQDIINYFHLDVNFTDSEILNFIDPQLKREKSKKLAIDLPDFITHTKGIFDILSYGNFPEDYQTTLDHLRTKIRVNTSFFLQVTKTIDDQSQKLNDEIFKFEKKTVNEKNLTCRNVGDKKVTNNLSYKETQPQTGLDTTNSQKADIEKKIKVNREIDHENYDKWKKIRKLNENLWINESRNWQKWPTFDIFINHDYKNPNLLADTIDSLAVQLYPQWTLNVISKEKCPDKIFFDFDNLKWIESGDESFFEIANREVCSEKDHWAIFLESGDQLSRHCLTSLASIINNVTDPLLIYTDHDFITNNCTERPQFKPDFNLDMLRSSNYIDRCFFILTEFFKQVGGFVTKLTFAEHYDLLLRSCEHANINQFIHLDDILISIRNKQLSRDEIVLKNTASKLAIQHHLKRTESSALVTNAKIDNTFRCIYGLTNDPLVSIIIPNKNNYELLANCINSIKKKSSYKNYEIIIVDNNSKDIKTLCYLEELKKENIKVIKYNKKFNYSEANNIGTSHAHGEYLVFLNNDIEIIDSNWLDILLSHCQRENIGAAGPLLIFPNGRVQHAGVIVGYWSLADHPFIGCHPSFEGYMNRLQIEQNYSAITGACLMVKRELFDKVGGFDQKNYQINFSDVDFCLKLHSLGYKNIWTPHVTLIHHTSVTQKQEAANTKKAQKAEEQFLKDKIAFMRKWLHVIIKDPAYNYNLSLGNRYFEIDLEENPGWPPAIYNVPRIWAYPRSKDGAGEYRIRRPLETLQEHGKALIHCAENMLLPGLLLRHRPSTIVFQTPTANEAISHLKHIRTYHDGLIIYEIDDLLHHVPFKNPAFNNLKGTNLKKRIKEAVSYCDRMIVSTKPLAEAYAGFCKDIRIVPNYISKSVWGDIKSSHRDGKKPRVGWAGAAFHYGDLMVIKDVVKDLADEVDWIFMGMCPDEIRPFVTEYHEGVDIDEYPAKLASLDLDLAIAPLEINAFNRAKSNLRILEYGILGWPVVATDIYPYQGAPVTLVKNRYKAWINAIRTKISDRDALIEEGQQLRKWILENWILEDHLDEILDAYI